MHYYCISRGYASYKRIIKEKRVRWGEGDGVISDNNDNDNNNDRDDDENDDFTMCAT